MWEVRDAQEGKVHPSVRERERGEWDTAAGLVGLSLRKPPKCKRLTAKTRGQASFYIGSLSIVGVGFVKIPPQFYEKGPFYV